FDDVDLFAAQLADDRLHAHALHADAGAYAIDVAVAALHSDLDALAGFAGAALDRHRAIVNLGHFLLEQAHHQFRRGARHQHSGALARFIDELDDAAHAIAHAVALEARLLLFGQLGFGLAEIENVVRPLDALDGAVDELAGAARVFIEDRLALGLADLLEDYLLGSLRGDASERIGVFCNSDFGADLGFGIDAPSFRKGHFVHGIGDR